MCTAKVRMYAPPANATPVTTSKPIQIPQGFAWERFVTAPSPLTRRMAMMMIPPRMMIPVMMLNGVRIFPLGFSSCQRNCRNPFRVPVSFTSGTPRMGIDLMLLFMVVLLPALFLFVGNEVVETEQDRRPEDVHERNGGQESGSQFRVMLRSQVGPEVYLFERDGREVHIARSPDLMFAVDVRVVPFRILVNPFLGLLDQVPPLSEQGGTFGTSFRARGLFTFRHAVGASDALLHERGSAVVFELRDVKGAGNHAISASHAAILVVDGRSFGHLLHRLAQAGRGAGRLGAMHALLPNEDRLLRALLVREPVYDNVGARGRIPFLLEHALAGKGNFRLGQTVLSVARLLAGAAADALGRVDEDSVELDTSSRGLRGLPGPGRLGPSREQDAAGCPRDLQEASSVDGHRTFLPWYPTLAEIFPDRDLQDLSIHRLHDPFDMNPSVRQGGPHSHGHRPVQGEELGETTGFPFQPRRGFRADPELLQVPGEVGRPEHERPPLFIGLLPRRRRVDVEPFIHRTDDAVDGGDELDPLARLEDGERRLALAKLRPVRGKLEPVDLSEDSLCKTVQPHLHGAAVGIELRPGVTA